MSLNYDPARANQTHCSPEESTMAFRAINVPSPAKAPLATSQQSRESLPKSKEEGARKASTYTGSDADVSARLEPPAGTNVSAGASAQSRSMPFRSHESSNDELFDIDECDWNVAEIVEKRIAAHGAGVEYLIRWEASVHHEKYIRTREDGSRYIRSKSGPEWDIRQDYPAALPAGTNEPRRRVEWEDSWHPMRDTQRAWGKIEQFLLRQPRQEEPSEFNMQPASVGRRLRPEKGKDYSRALRTFFQNTDGLGIRPQRSKLLAKQPVRPLVFRDRFIDEEREVEFNEDRKGNACLVYDTGFEQRVPCDRCARGCGLFPKCVVDEKFNNDACANCAYSSESANCNFSKKGTSAWATWVSETDRLLSQRRH